MKRANLTKVGIIESLRNLGIKEKDFLFVTADIMKVGYFNISREQTLLDWIDIFRTVVGEEGGIVMASYTHGFLRFKKKDIVFSRFIETYTGSLPNELIRQPDSLRSTHPTHSVIAIGKNLKPLIENHTETSLSYSILGDMINYQNSKFLMLGTMDKVNAPQATHYVQEELGYTKWSPYKFLYQIYYMKDGIKKLYTKNDYGGCSGGSYKLYGPLIVGNAIEIGKVGRAPSGLMSAQKSYQVIKSVLSENKRAVLCDDKCCTQCYGNVFYNGWGVFPFVIRKTWSVIQSRIKSKSQ